MRVAIVHYWLVGMRGGEKVLEALCDLFPEADIFTHVYVADKISKKIRRHTIRQSFISRLPLAARFYQLYLPFMPLALEQLDLRSYDLVISSESGPAKGVLTRPDALHICYCHTPMRYVWNMYHEYTEGANPLMRLMMPWLLHRLRQWDFQSAARVDVFVANAGNIARQIRKYYRRQSVVIPPPVDVDAFAPVAEGGDFYLHVGQLTRYKRVDLAIEACNRLRRPLIIIGDGEDGGRLRQLAGPTIKFLGRAEFDQLRSYYARCRALLFPGEEDFGIVPLEAMASGRPVIAYGRGGALETVVEGKTGIFFDSHTVDSLIGAIERFEEIETSFEPAVLVAHARSFSKEAFMEKFQALLAKLPHGALSHEQAESLVEHY